jgi:hypothetical protein
MQNEHADTENSADVGGRLEHLIGQTLLGRQVWLTVSPTDSTPHDFGTSPEEAIKAFIGRTGIDWNTAYKDGWTIVRAWTNYQVTGVLTEATR